MNVDKIPQSKSVSLLSRTIFTGPDSEEPVVYLFLCPEDYEVPSSSQLRNIQLTNEDLFNNLFDDIMQRTISIASISGRLLSGKNEEEAKQKFHNWYNLMKNLLENNVFIPFNVVTFDSSLT